MCGIAGYFGKEVIATSQIEETLELMQRRGPDVQIGRHFHHKPSQHTLHLLHARLSIIDLDERSNQPFTIGPYHLIFNGEIYNYREIRTQLEQQGVVFYTTSDTEVLLQAWITWGVSCLDKLDGMWAFAIYHEITGVLTLCRDRFGEKPLYYYETESSFYFASEIKFIQCLAEKDFRVNEAQLLRYLIHGYKSLYKKPETFFQDIHALPPATVLTLLPDGRKMTNRYWQPSLVQNPDMTFQEACAGARERLIHSVDQQLRADVPIAFCMSGGVDSNALISIAKKVLGYQVEGFTIVNQDARYEEMACIEASRDYLGIKHTTIPLSTEHFLSHLKTLVKQHDAPVYTITYYVHWLLMKAMSKAGYRISISGTAADELFSGYYDHHLWYLHSIFSQESLFQDSVKNWETWIKPIVRNPFLKDPKVFIKNPLERRHIYLDADIFTGFLKAPWQEYFEEVIATQDSLRNRMYNEIFYETTPVILHEDDLNAMYYSIENRSPFLDRALYEFCASIPTKHLIQQGRAKAVLREAMRGIVSDTILDERRKVGFNAPIEHLVDFQNPKTRALILEDSPIFHYIDQDRFEKLLHQNKIPDSVSKFIFNFLSAKFFLEENRAVL
jgi:asparagine synthase (glutamine-hydrolysing)